MGMGFTREQSANALVSTRNDVQRASNLLLDQLQ